jgi:hypothetical protein
MNDALIFGLIMVILFLNARRGAWKLRAKQKDIELQAKDKELANARQVIEAKMWRLIGVVRNEPDESEDWPERLN